MFLAVSNRSAKKCGKAEKILAVSGKTRPRGLWRKMCGKMKFSHSHVFPQGKFSFSSGNVEKTVYTLYRKRGHFSFSGGY